MNQLSKSSEQESETKSVGIYFKENMRVRKLADGTYSWDVQIMGEPLETKDVERLEELEKEIKNKFGGD
tara:strand:+ start:3924 stop:4130 length:207 start_codon:yes stop_codon:yes gene_type:complete